MHIHVTRIEALLAQLAEKTYRPLDHGGIKYMAEQISHDLPEGQRISARYLYESVFLGLQDATVTNKETVTLQVSKLNVIANFLGYAGFTAFCQTVDNPVDPVLASCVGHYYNYVRRNSARGVVLRSPVTIAIVNRKVSFALQGPVRLYRGELTKINDCLFVLMKADDGKSIHHVYRIGSGKRPNVLQGIFSGVSSAYDPTGGRTVLVRADGQHELSHAALPIRDLERSTELIDRRLGEYFANMSDNNLTLRGDGAATLGPDGLGVVS